LLNIFIVLGLKASEEKGSPNNFFLTTTTAAAGFISALLGAKAPNGSFLVMGVENRVDLELTSAVLLLVVGGGACGVFIVDLMR
jgi:hypothetical protein